MGKIPRVSILAGALLCALAPGAARAGGLVQKQFNLANFSNPLAITNRYWPLPAGRHIVFYEDAEGDCVVNDFVITNRSKLFGGAYAGLRARVVTDKAWLDEDCDGGRDVLLEDTVDWFAQDNAGNVWYFGEDTTEFEYDADGNPTGSSKLGSWQAGVGGAVAGLIMLAKPAKGLFYRQEYLAGVAEDYGKVADVDGTASIGIGDFAGCVVTKEWSPLAPGAVERKTYCPNVGLVQVVGYGGEVSGAEVVDPGF